MANNLRGYNDVLKNGIKQRILGANGIMYEFILHYGANVSKFYEEAIDVRSIKWGRARPSEKNGKFYRRGTYQPVGSKKHFTFYKLNHDIESPTVDEVVIDAR